MEISEISTVPIIGKSYILMTDYYTDTVKYTIEKVKEITYTEDGMINMVYFERNYPENYWWSPKFIKSFIEDSPLARAIYGTGEEDGSKKN